ncbi:MAG: hypothetical protein OES79_10440 [Planctomycetota bacterium]|nr:hypothetical protein [Planctomycetota bacterium]
MVDAIVASQELGDHELVRPLASLVASRNFNVATASLAALKQLAEQRKADDENAEAFREAGSAMLSLLNDPDINVKLRIAALEALRTLNDARLGKTLEKLVDQSNLENTGLLTEIQRALAST